MTIRNLIYSVTRKPRTKRGFQKLLYRHEWVDGYGHNRVDAIQAIDIRIIQYLSIFFNTDCPIIYLPVTVTREVTDEYSTIQARP